MRIVIVGGGYAGVACALRLARRARRSRAKVEIRLVNKSDVFIERIRLHQVAAGGNIVRRSLRALTDQAGVELVTGAAQAIDTQMRSVIVDGQTLFWDRLVLAVGSDPRKCLDDTYILVPDEIDVVAGRLAEESSRGGRATVIGGGLTGIEMASEIAERFPGLKVALLSRSPVAHGWSAEARAHVLAVLARLGVYLQEGADVAGEPGDRPPANLIFSTVGFRCPKLPREAGIAVSATGQVLVDPFLRSISQPDIYAVGDCAAPVLDPGDPLPMGCKSALPMGAHVGDILARELRDEEPEPFDFGLAFFCVSLGRRDGLIQWSDGRGNPTGGIFTGRRAAFFKEFVCRMTWSALYLESRGIPFTMSKRTGRAPRMLPAEFGCETAT